jgi:hypothetical protein
VRISAFELHVIDSAFYDTLYCLDERWDKNRWTYDAFGAPTSTIFGSGTSSAETSPLIRFLRLLSNQFLSLLRHLRQSTSSTPVLTRAFTQDNVNEYVLGKAYNELDLEDFRIDLSIESQGGGVFWRTTKHIRWFEPTLKAKPISLAMKMADEGTKSFLHYLQVSSNTAVVIW